ncbi:hypothetical protein CR513_23421, partial [Mucuna pruriens]
KGIKLRETHRDRRQKIKERERRREGEKEGENERKKAGNLTACSTHIVLHLDHSDLDLKKMHLPIFAAQKP